MDILNWLYIKTQDLIKTKPSNAETDLVAIGGEVPFTTRGDGYLTYGMTIKDLSVAGDVANTAHYELDLTTSNIVTVNTVKGIIDVTGLGSVPGLTPVAGFATSVPFYIDNPDLDLTVGNRDNVYVQYSVYYSHSNPVVAIPYLISTGFIAQGLGFNLYNANPTGGPGEWDGAFYVYYELYTID